MSTEVNIHAAQTSILRELLFRPQAGYSELQTPTGLSSDHFNFHIARLVELGLLEKVVRGQYRLTFHGKEFANRLDTDNNTVERQPKCAVIPALRRQRDGRTEYVFQERLKNPFYGFWGLPTGKIRWGETVLEAAARESLEETGLTATFKLAGVYHEHVRLSETNELLEDKIFFMVIGEAVSGELTTSFEGGINQWMTFDEFITKDKKFDSYQAELDILSAKEWMVERTASYSKEVF
jgi:ADP-ribose pyrophosphatase YjhB (NUDIX family)